MIYLLKGPSLYPSHLVFREMSPQRKNVFPCLLYKLTIGFYVEVLCTILSPVCNVVVLSRLWPYELSGEWFREPKSVFYHRTHRNRQWLYHGKTRLVKAVWTFVTFVNSFRHKRLRIPDLSLHLIPVNKSNLPETNEETEQMKREWSISFLLYSEIVLHSVKHTVKKTLRPKKTLLHDLNFSMWHLEEGRTF